MRKRALFALIVLSFVLSACGTPTVGPTPTPTRTPRPTETPTPIPTPTPAFPVTVGCAGFVPGDVCKALQALVTADPNHFSWVESVEGADIVLGGEGIPGAKALGVWTYAVAAPFFTVADEVASADLIATWQGTPGGPLTGRPLLVTEDTRDALTSLWGEAGESVQVVSLEELLTTAEALDAWAILPFHHLEPRWKVLRVDGFLPIAKRSLDGYPLQLPLYIGSGTRPETLALLPLETLSVANRDVSQMTLLAMTGVTAITRGTAQLIERTSVTYPAQDVKPWFEDADFVHISNEVSFKPDCPVEGTGSMSFCSDDRYIALLEEIGTNIVELTGNHLADKGSQWITHSLDMYRERGWAWFGGGEDLEDAVEPLRIEHGPNRIAFLGCNPIGPAYGLAAEGRPGATPCDYDRMKAQIGQLREEGYLPIVTLQYLETYEYFPTANQLYDFREFARAGALMVQGSQAHQAQTLELYDDTFIHYGLGNFFFDQMWSEGTRQEFVDRLTFYEGRLLSIDLRTALLEEYGRPRPMTPEERAAFLEMIFELRPRE